MRKAQEVSPPYDILGRRADTPYDTEGKAHRTAADQVGRFMFGALTLYILTTPQPRQCSPAREGKKRKQRRECIVVQYPDAKVLHPPVQCTVIPQWLSDANVLEETAPHTPSSEQPPPQARRTGIKVPAKCTHEETA
ncbi:hypothetical protein NDU88_004569 [Pleurodeles waltl]|uniref:Uncharacterized protein n=1 Tax=Pleurodeles waltl TaxID=8319 RepID=A0AAV7MC24_PLEWA|nr:hypothetical protein NDU88_004569 [Pleurodeles waltl]